MVRQRLIVGEQRTVTSQSSSEPFATVFEDDGETFAHERGQFATWSIRIDASAELHLSITRTGSFGATPKSIKLLLPASEKRAVTLATGRVTTDTSSHDSRILEVTL